MKRLFFILILTCSICKLKGSSSNDSLLVLFHNSFKTFELLRNEWGVYRDSKVFSGVDEHPASMASTGMGLISLCIGNEMSWIDDAEEKVLISLKTLTANNIGFLPDRNASGYFRHWISMEDGSQAWDSEYSTIDTGILISGALFCRNYFHDNDSIRYYADLLWNSVDWSKSIQDPITGGIYREMSDDGEGIGTSITLPFNEYMIVAWLALNQEEDSLGMAKQLWNEHYADPINLRKKDYEGILLLTDNPDNFLSSFVIQFPFYLCNYFTTNDAYIDYFSNARRGDSLWWAIEQKGLEYEWGLGAGSSNVNGYHPDAINNNPTYIYSPHIISGFLPVYSDGALDLLKLFAKGESIYALPTIENDPILWRKSLTELSWVAPEVQGIDYSTMLLGLATLPEFLGLDFFINNNNFFGKTIDTIAELSVSSVSTTNAPGSFVTIPIYADLAGNELCSFDIEIRFDRTLLAFVDVDGGDILPESSWFVDSFQSDSILKISGFSLGVDPLKGNGVLLNLNFKIEENAASECTILQLADASGGDCNGFNSLVSSSGIREICIVPFVSLSGKVYYFDIYNNTTDLALAGIIVHLNDSSGALVQTSTTDSEGIYRFHEIPIGGNYRIEPQSNDDRDFVGEIINPTDAFRVFVGATQQLPFSNAFQTKISDVNNSCDIDDSDAFIIFQLAAGQISSLAQFGLPTWCFVPHNFQLDNTNWCNAPSYIELVELFEDRNNLDFMAGIFGDANGNGAQVLTRQ